MKNRQNNSGQLYTVLQGITVEKIQNRCNSTEKQKSKVSDEQERTLGVSLVAERLFLGPGRPIPDLSRIEPVSNRESFPFRLRKDINLAFELPSTEFQSRAATHGCRRLKEGERARQGGQERQWWP